MSESQAKRLKIESAITSTSGSPIPLANPSSSKTKYDIQWLNNYIQWEQLMTSPMHNAKFKDKTFLINKNGEIKVMHIPNITYRQYARLMNNPNYMTINHTKYNNYI
jgi:hypothetical protein